MNDNPTHIRTVNGGTPQLITTRAALDEINAGMMDKAVKRTIRQMSAARGEADIEYRDGRKVVIRHATPEQVAELSAPAVPEVTSAYGRPARIVTVKGKRYIVGRVSQAKTTTHAKSGVHVWPGGVSYWSERDGERFGPVRTALANSRPGTVGATIWAAANQ